MEDFYLPKGVPMEFTNDFKTGSSSSEADEGLVQCCQYPSRRQKYRDRSTIIEFVHIPTEEQQSLIINNSRNSNERISENSKNIIKDRERFPERTREEHRLQHRLQHRPELVHLNAPHGPLPFISKDSGLSRDCSSSEETSVSTSVSTGFKYKRHLYSRYSSELEEENKMLKNLLREPWTQSLSLFKRVVIPVIR